MIKKLVAKYLPIHDEEVKKNDWYIDNGTLYKAFEYEFYGENGDKVLNIPNEPMEDFVKVKLFICSYDIQVGDKVYSDLYGTKQYVFDLNDPHTVLDLHHSEYKPYEIRTSHGFGPKENYFKILHESIDGCGVINHNNEFEYDDEKKKININLIPRPFKL